MIPRILAKKLRAVARKFPVVTLTGPRQSGKTTLVRSVFSSKPYASLEDPDTREFALTDPRGFLRNFSKGALLDEIQRAPALLSYLQGVVDQTNKPGLFILTGSQQFLLLEKISQTLAGRTSLLQLLPFSLEEIRQTAFRARSLEQVIFKGFYPRIYDRKIAPQDWYPSYIRTYLERDVRLIKNIGDLDTFQRFLKMCAARTGQLLNLSSLANDCGITHNTAKAWIGILEASFIIYLLRPYQKSFRKRLVKTPKLYFYDTGLVCSLMGLENEKQVTNHPLRGSLFETFILSELVKWRLHRGLPPNFYFWRDKTGHEIDCLIETGSKGIPVEIKASETVTRDSFRKLNDWSRISGRKPEKSFLVYAGKEGQERGPATVVSWAAMDLLTRYLD